MRIKIGRKLDNHDLWKCLTQSCHQRIMLMYSCFDFRRGRVVKLKCIRCNKIKSITFIRGKWFETLEAEE